MLKYFPDFDNLDLFSDVQLLDPRFEDDSDKNEEQPSLALYGDNFNTMLKVFVGTKKDPFALCVLQVDSGSCGASIETNYPNSLEGMTKGLSHIANIVEGDQLMGLDMYLTGSKFFPNFKVERPVDIDGDQIQLLEVSLGYWRKFGPLHAYIVDTFADGLDECQRIDLEEADLVAIAEAIMFEKLAKDEDSTGCFFGSPEMWAEDRADKAKHAATFVAASEWLRKQPESQWRSVYYQASW
jgi:hypothetical protein